MELVTDRIKSPLILLTGAGASVPLNEATTLGFLDLISKRDAELQSRDNGAAQMLRRTLSSARKQGLDVEDVLATLEDRAQLLDTLADDVELQREVINGDLPSGIGREIPALSQWRRLPAT